MVTASLAVSIRVWIKHKVQGGLSIDDYSIIVGYLATMGVSIASCITITAYHWSERTAVCNLQSCLNWVFPMRCPS
jgi:hypothetical protein